MDFCCWGCFSGDDNDDINHFCIVYSERHLRRQQDIASFGPLKEHGKAFEHSVPILPLNGPAMPSADIIESDEYLLHVRRASTAAVAGGYMARIGCLRAMFESRQDLFSLSIVE